MTFLASIRNTLNSGLQRTGFEIVRSTHHSWDDPKTFLPFQETITGAARAGLRVGDFVEQQHDRVGSSQETIDQMSRLGVFQNEVQSICEIGPGSGRYLEKTLALCPASRYEIYETASDWGRWLVKTYDVTAQPTDGRTLAATQTESIDLVQAHKVFVATPSLVTCSYLTEMARVVRPGGRIVFDILSERCLDSAMLQTWLDTRHHMTVFPALMPRHYVIDLLAERGVVFRGSFLGSLKPGKTECMVFVREP